MPDRKKEGFVLWFTGLPCSGKSTVADRVCSIIEKRGRKTSRLDGDTVRKTLSAGLGFSEEERRENIRRVAEMASRLSGSGIGVVASFVSPYRDMRESARRKTENFIEVFADCPPEECARRDVKGMYRLAAEGKIKNFTGVSDPYEPPLSPEVLLNTAEETEEESCGKVIKYLEEKGFIEKAGKRGRGLGN